MSLPSRATKVCGGKEGRHAPGYNRDWIERRLAYSPTVQIRGIYNLAEYLSERRRMSQEWANDLDGLRTKAVRRLTLNKT